MADQSAAMTDTSLSPINTGPSDDLLAALDEMLGFTPEIAASMDSLGASYVADAFEFPEVPNPYEQQPVEEPKREVPEVKLEQPADPVRIVTTRPAQLQTQQQRSAQRGKNATYSTVKPLRRKRPKDELDYLRAKVADMEKELAKLNRSTGRFSSVSDDDEEMFARWKLVAKRQKEEANKTIVENLKLRAMLKGQLEIAKRRKMAIANYHQQAASQALPWSLVKMAFNLDVEDAVDARRPHAPSISDEVIFAELNESAEAQYAQVGSLLRASGIADVNRELLGKVQLKQDLNGISFGLQEVRLMPFAAQAVARVIWSILLYNSGEMPGRIQTRVINNDLLNAKIVDTLQLPKSQRAKVSSRFAVRRYFEGHRVVVVWSGCVEIAGSVFVRLREKGFVAVSPFDLTEGKVASTRPEGCVARAVVDLIPETAEFSTGADAKKQIEEMTDLVLGTYHRTLGIFSQVMETLLLQDLRSSSA